MGMQALSGRPPLTLTLASEGSSPCGVRRGCRMDGAGLLLPGLHGVLTSGAGEVGDKQLPSATTRGSGSGHNYFGGQFGGGY